MSKLHLCPLFRGMSPVEIDDLLSDRFEVKTFRPGELVALQGSISDQLLIVSEGLVRGEMTDALGRSTLIEEIPAPRAVAPAFLYATENRLPVAVVAAVSTEIVCIRRTHFTSMMQQDARLLTNYLQSMADRSRFLSEKLRMQRFGTIKSKLARYFLELSQRMGNGQQPVTTIEMQHTQQQLADMFGVTRPALARTLKQLETAGLVLAKNKQVQLLDRKGLMNV